MNIWKFEVPISGFTVTMPQNARVLSAGVRGHRVVIWAIVDPVAKLVRRRFPIYETGHSWNPPNKSMRLVGTVFMNALVLHVFDGGEIL